MSVTSAEHTSTSAFDGLKSAAISRSLVNRGNSTACCRATGECGRRGQVKPTGMLVTESTPGGVSTKLHSLVGKVTAKGVEIMPQNGGDGVAIYHDGPQGSLVSLGEGLCLSGR